MDDETQEVPEEWDKWYEAQVQPWVDKARQKKQEQGILSQREQRRWEIYMLYVTELLKAWGSATEDALRSGVEFAEMAVKVYQQEQDC